MLNISRENVIKLISDIRKVVENEIDLKRYFGESFIQNNIERNEVDEEVPGVSNGFLAEMFRTLTGYEIEIYGDVEKLHPCPCCGLRTLTEEYDLLQGTGYDICPYCKWEDDGTTEVNEYRSLNRGSIEDYRDKIRTNVNKYYINKWFEK